MSELIPENLIMSIQGRLKNIARKEKLSYNLIVLLYCQERLLYRLSDSKYRSNFILKGGLLLFSITNFKSRPTIDIDFLAQNTQNDLEKLRSIMQEICSLPTYEDGLLFLSDNIKADFISEANKYNGVRFKVPVLLGKHRQVLQIDIGFGDIVIPKPQNMTYPVLLANMKEPDILSYSLESVIAEKFEAMITLSLMNSRMKDFYDIYILLSRYDFEGRVLQESVASTFSRRGTIVEREHLVFSKEFALDENRNRQWDAFLLRTGLSNLSFDFIMAEIDSFLRPIYDAINKEQEFYLNWSSELSKWQ